MPRKKKKKNHALGGKACRQQKENKQQISSRGEEEDLIEGAVGHAMLIPHEGGATFRKKKKSALLGRTGEILHRKAIPDHTKGRWKGEARCFKGLWSGEKVGIARSPSRGKRQQKGKFY